MLAFNSSYFLDVLPKRRLNTGTKKKKAERQCSGAAAGMLAANAQNDKAYRQTMVGDDGETKSHQCTKCKHKCGGMGDKIFIA